MVRLKCTICPNNGHLRTPPTALPEVNGIPSFGVCVPPKRPNIDQSEVFFASCPLFIKYSGLT